MYLSPPSSCYQWTSRSLVFTNFPDPAIPPDYIHHSMASSNTSQRLQNFSQHSKWVRYMFGLRTSQGYIDGEIGVEENQEKMCK